MERGHNMEEEGDKSRGNLIECTYLERGHIHEEDWWEEGRGLAHAAVPNPITPPR